jgi:hypothetical protein
MEYWSVGVSDQIPRMLIRDGRQAAEVEQQRAVALAVASLDRLNGETYLKMSTNYGSREAVVPA